MTEKQVEQFTRDGFLNGGSILTAEQVDGLSVELDRILDKGPDGFGGDTRRPVQFRDLSAGNYTEDSSEISPTPVWQIVNIWQASDAFEALLHTPALIEAIAQMSGFSDIQVWHDQVQYKPACAGGSTGWHQDAPKWPAIEPMTPVSAWIPLDDADEANGCMWMVPGSHEWGDVDAYLAGLQLSELDEFSDVGKGFEWSEGIEPSEIRAVPCPVRRGEVHFHHSLTWHGSPRNHSTRPRRAVAIHFMASDAVYTGCEHLMQPLIQVAVGGKMRDAGAAFPAVMRDGVNV